MEVLLLFLIWYFQAIILKQSLTTGSNSGYDHVINKLTEVISNAQAHHKKGIKAQKVWCLYIHCFFCIKSIFF